MNQRSTPTDWRSYNLSEDTAGRILKGLDLHEFISEGDRGAEVKLDGEVLYCGNYFD